MLLANIPNNKHKKRQIKYMVEIVVPLHHLQENGINPLWQQDPDLPKYQPRKYNICTIGKDHSVAWVW